MDTGRWVKSPYLSPSHNVLLSSVKDDQESQPSQATWQSSRAVQGESVCQGMSVFQSLLGNISCVVIAIWLKFEVVRGYIARLEISSGCLLELWIGQRTRN